jgi:hypothetical protein
MDFSKAIKNLWIILYLIVASFIWLSASTSAIKQSHFVLFFVTIGLLFTQVTSKIIFAHMTRSSFPQFKIPVALLAIPLFVHSTGLAGTFNFHDGLYLKLCFVFSLLYNACWIYETTSSICSAFNIKCFSLGRSK